MIWLLLSVAEPTFDAEVEACSHSEQILSLCMSERYSKRADSRLNAQWQTTLLRVRAVEGVKAVDALRRQQRRWITARDRQCAKEANASPVQQHYHMELICLSRLNERRTAELRKRVGK